MDLSKYDSSGFLTFYLTEQNEYEFSSVKEGYFAKNHQHPKDTAYEKVQQFLENVTHIENSKNYKLAEHQLVNNSILNSFYKQKGQGVSRGFFTYLRVVGVGYRTFLAQGTLTLKLGFSHFVKVDIPKSVQIFLPEPTLICLYGLDKNQITQIAATIRQIKPPSPYKGKGIRTINSKIRLKTGKKKS